MYNLTYLKESLTRAKGERKEYNMGDSIEIYIKDRIDSDNIDVENVMSKISTSVPSHLLSEVDTIYIGLFAEFEEMETNAMYKDGAIYVTNEQSSEQDLIDDIVHEIAHSLESPYGDILYADGELEREFLQKRKRLYEILKEEGAHPDLSLFINPDYTKEFDLYLYEEIGYDRLNLISATYSLFTSAYSATALREYFANGFEYYFLDDRAYLQEICPILFRKIEEINENDIR
jgi:hypothetical protein